MGRTRPDEFRKDAVHIALTSGLTRSRDMCVHLPLTLDHVGLEISGFDQIDGWVSPSGFTSMISDLFLIALWDLSQRRHFKVNRADL